MFTDKRKGHNGKSTIAKLVNKALGDYARKGSNALIYKTDNHNETVDSHSAGMIAYQGIRVACFEELDPKRMLNNQELKDRNGGNSMFEGRHFRSDKIAKFTWGTKMLLLFNDANFPQFDFTDSAHLDRMLIIHHCSRFYKDEEQFLEHRHENYTYRAEEIVEKLDQWRPYFLIWALEGLKNYWIINFRHIPKECKKWKESLINKQDTVKEFVEMYIEKTKDLTNTVSKVEAYKRYMPKYESERNPNTKIGEVKLLEKMKELLDETRFVERDKYHCSYWKGYCLKEDKEDK
ncbi:hypothetical protein BDK51DRAFT_48039 [Blyttiomyces helicus]|uniref:Uncharacterized protein n=1 Tax=Blyttiomyces helicus TaxID=388810 RepID=A0A4P9VZ39_9FUNG|nr:hypothetical protein BDK51DRAFT_48039 [Blyttiomyces helicus]|eukprot:RKO83610.1 hypothetical protein BDK51DRAFT_48039 [Blyttiomyces helicus]